MTSKLDSMAQSAVLAGGHEKQERDWLYLLGLLLALVGVAISAYLTYVKVADKAAICAATQTIDCEGVQNSVYSEILGIPIAILGLGAYLSILGIFVLENRVAFLATYGKTLLFSFTLFGVLYSGYLTYIEGFVLEKWCMWCVASAITMLGLFVASTARLMRSFDETEIDDSDDE